MKLNIDSTTTLHNGVAMPWLGLGVFQIPDGNPVEDAVSWAIEEGYRHIDTAALYGNEAGVGNAIRRSPVARDEMFVTTKVWNTDQGYSETLKAFAVSLERLDLGHVDLYLIHWPCPSQGKAIDTWRALEKLYEDGRARAIGVSNFLPHHLEDLMAASSITPMVNQVEFHPHLQQPDLVAFCESHDIRLTAWSPLKRGQILLEPTLGAIAARHGKSTAQVILRWLLQRGIVVIPKSVRQVRVIENADIYDFELSLDEMAEIDRMDRNERIGPHPDQL